MPGPNEGLEIEKVWSLTLEDSGFHLVDKSMREKRNAFMATQHCLYVR